MSWISFYAASSLSRTSSRRRRRGYGGGSVEPEQKPEPESKEPKPYFRKDFLIGLVIVVIGGLFLVFI